MKPSLRILGIRGVPAAHGGFETFAQALALDLVAKGWDVTVYCQEEGAGPFIEDTWNGIQRVRIPVAGSGPRSTVAFDWKATLHASSHHDLCLTLGYNTAVFCALLKARGVPNVINMDGIEWQRAKWGVAERAWFRANEWLGCVLGDTLVADHPEIKVHLTRSAPAEKIVMIPYGAERITAASTEPVRSRGLEPGRYLTLIARAEPENSILEVVQAYSRRPRGMPLVVLGNYAQSHPYQRRVLQAASDEVCFVGAIYDKPTVQALRQYCALYVHGHQVGGTNPSLVEALGAGNPVLAHDNRFNRWVAGDSMRYFNGADEASAAFDDLLGNRDALVTMAAAAVNRFEQSFRWPTVLEAYETLLRRALPSR